MNLMTGPRWVWAKIRQLRALIKDDDHDPWLDNHPRGRQDKSPNIGPNLGSGG